MDPNDDNIVKSLNQPKRSKNNFFCESCDYKTTRPSDWLKHTGSQKHQRNGEKKDTVCDIC